MKKNIIIIFKNNYEDDDDSFGSGTYSVEYKMAKLEFKGEYLLLESSEQDSGVTKVEIHPLKTIKAFKYDNKQLYQYIKVKLIKK